MANKKFSEFVLKTSTSDVSHIVGYNGAENVQITPANFVTGGGTGVFLPLAGGTMTGTIVQNGGNISFSDGRSAVFGTGNDLEIYHDGSNSYINETGTGNLYLKATSLILSNSAGSNYLIGNSGGSVNMYYNGSQKFETTSTGISITGNGVFTDDVSVAGSGAKIISASSSNDNATFFLSGSGSGKDTRIVFGNNRNFLFETSSSSTPTSTGTPVLTLDTSLNATFAGTVTTSSQFIADNATLASLSLRISGTETGRLDNFNSALRLINFNATSETVISGNGNISLTSVGSSNILFNTTNLERMRLDSSGNLGLGTSNPQSKLHVDGDIRRELDGTSTIGFGSGTASAWYSGMKTVDFGAQNIGLTLFTTTNAGTTNVDALTIDEDGNVGIGTSTPQAKIHVKETSAVNTAIFENTGTISYTAIKVSEAINNKASLSFAVGDALASTDIFGEISGNVTNNGGALSGNLTFKTNSGDNVQERMRLDDTGNLGVGTSTPNAKLDVESLVNYQIMAKYNDANYAEYGYFGLNVVGSGNPYIFNMQGTERMRLTSGGDLFIGNSTFSSSTRVKMFEINPSCIALKSGTSATTLQYHQEFHNPNGFIGSISTENSATSYTTTSDYRLKEDLQDFKGLELVSKIPVYDYKWKAEDSRSYGVMAHELAEVLPQAVTGDKDAEKMQSVDYSKIVPLLVKSIQELTAKVEKLELNK